MIAASRDEDLSAWIAAVRAGQSPISAYRAVSKELPVFSSQRWHDIRTDAEGRFRLSGIGRERVVSLQVTGTTIVTKTISVATRRMEAMSQPAYPDPFFLTNYGAEFEYRAAPSRPIEGVVRDAKTGEVLPGVHVWSAKFAGEGSHGFRSSPKQDGQGRSLPPGRDAEGGRQRGCRRTSGPAVFYARSPCARSRRHGTGQARYSAASRRVGDGTRGRCGHRQTRSGRNAVHPVSR